MKYKERLTIEERKKESNKIKERYPTRIPTIIEKSDKCKGINELDKSKYLVPNDITIGQLIFVIRKRLNLDSKQVIFFFNNNSLFPVSSNISEIYKKNKDEDGFLYFIYTTENTFGN